MAMVTNYALVLQILKVDSNALEKFCTLGSKFYNIFLPNILKQI